MLNWLSRRLARADKLPVAEVIPRDQHPISRQHISNAALKVMYRLIEAGYEAHLVGGSVRDLLLGKQPKDFDIATSATPEQVKGVFRHAHIIGQRFRIVHVRFGHETIEVTTFRGSHHKAAADDDVSQRADGMLLRDNAYGSIEEDAVRRDFTVNALYYSVADFAVRDFCHGMRDIQAHLIRMIGDPETRYTEDPVRMLRAVRLAAKLDFTLEKKTAAPIPKLANRLNAVPPARLFDEVLKLFLGGHALATWPMLRDNGLFAALFPQTAQALHAQPAWEKFLHNTLSNTDNRIRQEKTVTPAYLFAALLWPAVKARLDALQQHGTEPWPALQQGAEEVLREQQRRTVIPRRFSTPMMEIWSLQLQLPRRNGGRAARLLAHPRFRAGYDFVLLRESAGEDLQGLGEWWTQYQAADEDERQAMTRALDRQGAGPKSGRRPRRRRRRPQREHSAGEA